METPLVVVIILNYQRRDDTLECVSSVLSSDYENMEVVVVDNASGDDTAASVRGRFPSVHVIENQNNLMYAGGNNVALRYAIEKDAAFVLLLNNDTVVDKGMIGCLVEGFMRYPEAGIFVPLIYYYHSKDADRQIIWYAGGIVELSRGLTAHRGIRECDTGRYAETQPTGYATGCGMMISGAALKRVGLLDESYYMYAEDADYSLRVLSKGFAVMFAPKAKMWHKVSLSTGGEFSFRKLKLKARANLLLLRRYAKPWHWLTIPFFVAVRILKFAAQRLFG